MRRLFEVNSEPHTGARPSVRLCVGLITFPVATFTALYDSLNELLAQLLELAARWSPNYSSVGASSPLELFFFHLKRSTKAFGLQVTRGCRIPNGFAEAKHTVHQSKGSAITVKIRILAKGQL